MAGTVLLLSTLLLSSAVDAQSREGGFSFGPEGAPHGMPQGSRFVLDKLVGGEEEVVGSGRIATKDFNIRGFTRVDVSHAFQVKIVQGSSYQVVLRVEDHLLERLRIAKRGEKLMIGLKPMMRFNLRKATMEAEVHMPDLRGIGASGASDVRISGFSSDRNLDVDVSGASSVEGEITAQDVSIEASGASRVRLQGEAGDLRIDASGASHVDLEDFPAQDADIELSGASEAKVVLNGNLDIDASGASHLYFGGSPSMGRVDLSGASSIKRR
jgi:hypothetical protein